MRGFGQTSVGRACSSTSGKVLSSVPRGFPKFPFRWNTSPTHPPNRLNPSCISAGKWKPATHRGRKSKKTLLSKALSQPGLWTSAGRCRKSTGRTRHSRWLLGCPLNGSDRVIPKHFLRRGCRGCTAGTLGSRTGPRWTSAACGPQDGCRVVFPQEVQGYL